MVRDADFFLLMEAATRAKFGKPQKGDFNWWMENKDDDEE